MFIFANLHSLFKRLLYNLTPVKKLMINKNFRAHLMIASKPLKNVKNKKCAFLFAVYTAGFLDGAVDGLEFLFNPEWDKLLDPNIWAKAASQILFSLSVGFGSQLVLSSYNSFK